MKNKVILSVLILCSIGLLLISEIRMSNSHQSGLNDEKVEQVLINEIIPSNRSLRMDTQGNYVDMIELYNPSKEVIHLEGYGLSDDPKRPHRWVFPEVSIEPGELLLIYLSKTITSRVEGEIFADFALDKGGEVVTLSDSEGEILQMIPYTTMADDMSIGLIDGKYQYLLKGTPGDDNQGVIIADMGMINQRYELKSHESGIYSEPITIDFEMLDGYELRYTLDGSDPTPESPLYTEGIYLDYSRFNPLRLANIQSTYEYQQPVSTDVVNKGTVVKAQYFKGEVPLGNMFVGSYFIWEEGIERYSFDIVSLSTDPSNLFDSETGIYVFGDAFRKIAPMNVDGGTQANYNQRGRDWERDAYIEFFDPQGRSILSQGIGIRTFGNWSRANAKKSFKLFARKEYDHEGNFEYPFFDGLVDYEGNKIDTFERLILRSGANDWAFGLIRDPLITTLVDDIATTQAFKPVILFLNGEYWGIYHLREHMDLNYLSSHYHVNPEETAIVLFTPDGPEVQDGEISDVERYEAFLKAVSTMDFSLETSLEYVEEYVDLENLIDYYSTQIFINNADWPGNNAKIWRYKGEPIHGNPYTDGRYRYLLYDTEFSMGLYEGVSANQMNNFYMTTTNQGEIWPNPPWSTLLFGQLMKNDIFRENFLVRLCDHMNSRFEIDTFNSHIDSFKELYKPEMEEYINRYFLWGMQTLSGWEHGQINQLYGFVRGRQTYLLKYGMSDYGLEGYSDINIEHQAGGYVRVNDCYDVSKINEDISELTYYNGHQIELQAIPNEGFKFVGWNVMDTSTGETLVSYEGFIRDQEVYNVVDQYLYFHMDSEIVVEPVFEGLN